MKIYKEHILRLREEGLSHNKIAEQLGCSRCTVAYHCSPGFREKLISTHKQQRKDKKTIYPGTLCKKRGSLQKRHLEKLDWTSKQMLEKIGDNPVCYLTGKPIDLNTIYTYALDHVIPVSKGGSGNLDNIELCDLTVNYSKGAMTKEEFIQMCIDVLSYNGYEIKER